ncbi:MAG: hypothetical protein GY754_02880 [bacterium]|nr:hypothetical protein [bacterium]
MDKNNNMIFQRVTISIVIFLLSLFIINSTINLSLVLEVRSSENGDICQIFYNTGKGFNKREVITKYIPKTDKPELVSFNLPLRKIAMLRIDPATNKTHFFIKSISLTGCATEYYWKPADIIRILKPANQVGRFAIQGDATAIETLGNDPFLVTTPYLSNIINSMSDKVVLYRNILAAFIFVLLLWFFFSQASVNLCLRLFPHPEDNIPLKNIRHTVPILLFFVSSLILSMAVTSGYNTHPDEDIHISSANYYISHWLPPEVGNPETIDSYSNKYGRTYLNEPDIVYFIAGKFSVALENLQISRYTAIRLFNVSLFLLLALMSVQFPKNRYYFSVLLMTPQIWYIFSYFNGDAFPLFLSVLLGYQIIITESAFNKFLSSQSRDYMITGGFFTAFLLGLLMISKKNFYIFVLFVIFFFGWSILTAQKNSRKNKLIKYSVVLLAAFSILIARYAYDIIINGFDKEAKILACAEKYADPGYKPSLTATSSSFFGLRLRDKGVSYMELFSKYKWHILCFTSFVGGYGWMSIYAGNVYYLMFLVLLLLFILFFLWCVFTKFDKDNRIFAILALLFVPGMIFLSTYHSWTGDLQAQGRYLFPFLPIVAVLIYKNEEYLNTSAISSFTWIFFLMSAYSFVFIALDAIPK